MAMSLVGYQEKFTPHRLLKGCNLQVSLLIKLVLRHNVFSWLMAGFFSGPDQKGKQLKLSEALLQSIRLHCTKLKHLALVNCRLDYFTRPFRNLPRTLVRLRLKNVKFDNLPFLRTLSSSPLMGLGKVLTVLKEVVITQDCDWFIKPDEAALKSTLKQVELERVWI